MLIEGGYVHSLKALVEKIRSEEDALAAGHARPERYRWPPAVRLLDSVAWLRTRIAACLSEWMVTGIPPYVHR